MKRPAFLALAYALTALSAAELAVSGERGIAWLFLGITLVMLQIRWYWTDLRGTSLLACLLAAAGILGAVWSSGRLFLAGSALWLLDDANRRSDLEETWAQPVTAAVFTAAALFLGRMSPIPYWIALLAFFGFAELYRVEASERRLSERLKVEWRLSKLDLERQRDELEQAMGSLGELYTLKERNRMSREIHDSVGHSLSTLLIQLDAIRTLAERGTEKTLPAIASMAGELREFTAESLAEVRRVIADNKPRVLMGRQLSAALAELCEETRTRTGAEVTLNAHLPDSLDERRELAVYRAVQEAISNAVHHGRARSIRVYLIDNGAELLLTVSDDGRGTEQIVPHVGLMGIEERIRELGGTLTTESAPGEGFTLRAVIPNGEGGTLGTD